MKVSTNFIKKFQIKILTGWLHIHLQLEVVADFRRVDLLALVGDDAHLADWRWSGIGNGSGRGQHRDIEAQCDILLASLVDTLDVVGLSLVGHQLRMFLDDQHEAGHILDGLHTAAAKVNAEDLSARHCLSGQIHDAATLLVLAVALHVEHSIEARLGDVNLHLDSIGQTTDHHVGAREVGTEVGVVAVQLRITSVSSNALALGAMVDGITERIYSAHLGEARILAGLGVQVAVPVVGALVVAGALWWLVRLAFTARCQAIAKIDRTSAASAFVDNHAALKGAHTVTGLVDAEALFHQTGGAVLVDIQGGTRRADTLAVHVAHEALLDDAQGSLVALHGCIAGVSLQALTDHGPHRKGIPHVALGIHSARLGGVAGIDTFPTQAGSLAGTVRIADADRNVTLRFAAVLSGHSSWWAGTLRSMLVHLAEFVVAANGGGGARIVALAINTGLVRGTLVVGATAQRSASNSGVSAMSWNTLANGAMFDGQALGVGAALLTLAGRDAELVAARMCSGTIRVDGALDLGALELGIALVSLATGAHWLMVLDAAFGVQSAVAGIPADAVQARLVRGTVRV